MKKLLLKYPFFLFLLPVFFVLHGLNENAGLVPVTGAAMLLLFYLGVSIGLLLFFYLFYRQFRKAALIAFSLLAYQFFSGLCRIFSAICFQVPLSINTVL